MLLTADDIAAITRRPQPKCHVPKVSALDERHYWKIHVFDGIGWTDLSFQFNEEFARGGFRLAVLAEFGTERH